MDQLNYFFANIADFMSLFLNLANFIIGEKDGNYFLKILQNETHRLLKLADIVENELENSDSIPEEIIGQIRSASGKARLLVSQKMQQFKGLCTNNITQVIIHFS